MNTALILSWIWTNIVKLGILGIVLVKLKTVIRIFILEPLQGDDKKTSTNELAKFILLACLIWTLQVNGARETQWAPYSDATIAALIVGVSAIAAIKPIVGVLGKRKEEDFEPKK